MQNLYALRYYLVTLVYLLLLYLAYLSVRNWFSMERRRQWMVSYLNELSPEKKLDLMDSLHQGHPVFLTRWGGALQLEVLGEGAGFSVPADSFYLDPAVNEQGVLWRRYGQWIWNDLILPTRTTPVEIPDEFYPTYGGYRNIRCWEKGCIPLADPGSARFAILDEKQRILPILINELPVGAGPTAVYRGWGGWCVGTVVGDTWQVFRVGAQGHLQLMTALPLPQGFSQKQSGIPYRFLHEDQALDILSWNPNTMIIRCPVTPAANYPQEAPDTVPMEIYSLEQRRWMEIFDHKLPTTWAIAELELSGDSIRVSGTYVWNPGSWESAYISANLVTRMAMSRVNEPNMTLVTLCAGMVVSYNNDIPYPPGMDSSQRVEVYPGDYGGTLVQARLEDSITLVLHHYRLPRSAGIAEWVTSDSISDQISLQNLPLEDEFGGLVIFPHRWLHDGPGPLYFGRGADTLRPMIDVAGLRLLRKFGRVEYTIALGEIWFRGHYGDYYELLLRVDPATGRYTFVGPYMDINPKHLPFAQVRVHIEPFISGVVFVMTIVVYFALLMLVNYLLRDSQQTQAPDHISIWPDLPGALREKYQLLHDNSQALRVRSDIMLLMGVLIGIFGLAFFWAVSSGASAPSAGDADWIVRIRPLALLVFIETIAFFFLRQYRIIYNEYKRFAGLKIRLMNFITALEMYMKPTNTFPEGEQVKNLLDILQTEPLNLTSKTDEPLDTHMLLDLLKQAMNK